ncbi:hypothetical protein U2F10_02990 [Leptothoe sp. EHU-05/26/07-4]
MARKRATGSTTSTPEEEVVSTPLTEEIGAPEPSSSSGEKENKASIPTPKVSAPPPPSPPPSEVQLRPAEFKREGRTMVCTVCGTEARQNLDQELFCPNAHNHPPLATSEAA